MAGIRNFVRWVFLSACHQCFRLPIWCIWCMIGKYPPFLREIESAYEETILMEMGTRRRNIEGDLLKDLEAARSEVDRLREVEKTQSAELLQVQADRDENLQRLSEIMSSRLRDNNPNIADLDDPNRPTKLADVFSEIYDNEWTGAFEVLEDSRGEPGSIALLLDVVMEAHMFCVEVIDKQWDVVHESILWDMDDARAADTIKWLKDARKSHALTMLPKVQTDFEQRLKAMSLFSEDEFANNNIQEYVGSCIRLCWLMSVQDPPVVFRCPGWSSKSSGVQVNQGLVPGGPPGVEEPGDAMETDQAADGPSEQDAPGSPRPVSLGREDDKAELINEEAVAVADIAVSIETTPAMIQFDKDLFREYTSKGNVIEFVVWPVMYLCKDGPILKKGVAQGCKRV